MTYRLYIYDTWGNTEDGFEVNDIITTNVTLPITDATTEQQINHILHAGKLKQTWENPDVCLLDVAYTGQPFGELRRV